MPFSDPAGISRGCSLSPVIGAFYLKIIDQNFEDSDLFYVRYMDDILVMATTRWKLRRAVAALQQRLGRLKLKIHPDKTMIGRIEKGFDFLGYHFSRQPLRLAGVTVEKFHERTHRLYEQQPGTKDIDVRLGEYICRWRRWAEAGLKELQPLDLLAFPAATD